MQAAVAVDGSGNVVVRGSSDGRFDSDGNTIRDHYTAKYAAADGVLIWEMRYTSEFVGHYTSGCLALGPNGMIAVITDSSSDGEGATVVYRETAEAVSIGLLPTGVHVRFTGVPGRSYNIERAPAVTGPWSTINTQSASASGPFEYLNTNS